jgi:predicted 3-demethylubiquinone-9 3-methyltransferase (glyoxalase superfamily)
MKKVTPFLWFDHGKAEEAARYYVSIFPRSKLISAGPLVTTFRIEDQELMALNGGPEFELNEAFSLYVNCRTQKEIDTLWSKLSKGGKKSRCGWLRDRYGLWWQLVPAELPALLKKNGDAVMGALLKMGKLDLETLRRAAR